MSLNIASVSRRPGFDRLVLFRVTGTARSNLKISDNGPKLSFRHIFNPDQIVVIKELAPVMCISYPFSILRNSCVRTLIAMDFITKCCMLLMFL